MRTTLLIAGLLAAGPVLSDAPAAPRDARAVHPRLFADAARFDELRAARSGTHQELWKEVRDQADQLARQGPPAYREQDGHSGAEQLYQREVGNAMPCLAMAWKLTGDRKYLGAAGSWALASCKFPTWGLGKTDGMDLAAGHQLFGLGIVYDWCHDDLDAASLRTIRETILRRGDAMYRAAAAGKIWWHRSYLQNHLWVNICGLSVAGLAVADEHPAATNWVALSLAKFRTTMDTLGPDGASHEGVGYWEYGAEYMLKFMFVARSLLGENLYDHDWWRRTAGYPLYLGLPRNAWNRRNCVVDLADAPRGHWYGSDYLLRNLAHEFRDGHAQWLAEQIDEANVDSPSARWLNLIWFDPSVEPRPTSDLPTLKHFPDIGIVSARTDWSGDESLVVFKCGPPLGHEATDRLKSDAGSGHVHPDANHFVVFGNGEWLLRGSGYVPKLTELENTLVIAGAGQMGEGKMWFQGAPALAAKAHPRILRTESTPSFDHFAGDATEAYPKSSGLRRFVRHLIFLKPDVLIVADDIAVEASRTLDLFFHPEKPLARGEDGAFLGTSGKASFRFDPLTPEAVTASIEAQTGSNPHGGSGYKLSGIRLRTSTDHWRNAVALSWSAATAAPARVVLKREAPAWRFSAGGAEMSLDWDRGEATMKGSR